MDQKGGGGPPHIFRIDDFCMKIFLIEMISEICDQNSLTQLLVPKSSSGGEGNISNIAKVRDKSDPPFRSAIYYVENVPRPSVYIIKAHSACIHNTIIKRGRFL